MVLLELYIRKSSVLTYMFHMFVLALYLLTGLKVSSPAPAIIVSTTMTPWQLKKNHSIHSLPHFIQMTWTRLWTSIHRRSWFFSSWQHELIRLPPSYRIHMIRNEAKLRFVFLLFQEIFHNNSFFFLHARLNNKSVNYRLGKRIIDDQRSPCPFTLPLHTPI